MTNLEQLRDALRVRIGLPASDAMYTAPVLDDLVNESIQAISLEADWFYLQATAPLITVVGQQLYTPPVLTGHTWLRTVNLTPVDSYALAWRSVTEIREVGSATADSQYYSIFGDQLMLAPIPSRVYTIVHDYIRTEPILFDVSSQPLIPVPFRPAVVHLGAAMAHLRQNELTRYESEMRAYQTWLTRMRDNRRRSADPARVRVRAGRMF